ncbi:MAG: phosphatidylglycerophosphatase A [Candidatus Latescibacteria bacterium]|nr:phosphatidylglycerophosphatase A [Candidatus Latescibacterota bacterium]NIM21140.1 phosphatidylglycerophosphatase A [Candidatus Latescibacterota bacterium]NIM65275.1 phosphatidylglycerophosphatase A [Candidatus Latescibacterota bacterium]NIO01790.1 phosphatidylglycerophosphatase A [Candidatus Latescibacterota bacterium]NIO28307.1 phosphatidylglycerophosphatase A [Candidatus Latescibacterota bacterium]
MLPHVCTACRVSHQQPAFHGRESVRVNFLITLFGSFGFSGFFPFAPATFASLVFAAVLLIPGGPVIATPIVFAWTIVASVPIATRMEKRFGRDASCIVIDEVVGMQTVFAGAVPSAGGVLLGFFIFRIFDILKPFPIRRSQNLPGGYGVVCDDFLAGIYARIALIVLSYFIPGIGVFF